MSDRLKEYTKRVDNIGTTVIRYNTHASKWYSDWWHVVEYEKENLLYHMMLPMGYDKFIIVHGLKTRQVSTYSDNNTQFSLLARVIATNMQTQEKRIEYRDCHVTFNFNKVCFHRGAKQISKQEFENRLIDYDPTFKAENLVQLLRRYRVPDYMWHVKRDGKTRDVYPFDLIPGDKPYATKVSAQHCSHVFDYGNGESDALTIQFFGPYQRNNIDKQ